MKRKRYPIFAILVVAAILQGCDKEIAIEDVGIHTSTTNVNFYNTNEGMLVLGDKIDNPYEISNMRKAYSMLCETSDAKSDDLQPNCLYVRFLPKDSSEYNTLLRNGLELFDFPLDYEISVDGNYYHDPSLPDTTITWQYTTVDPDFRFPEVEHEVLAQCYIPDDEEDTKGVSNTELEKMAYTITGNKDMLCDDTKSKYYPGGHIYLETANDTKEPLMGVKIRCHNVVKWETSYTNSSGYYLIPKKWSSNIHYAILFDNAYGFSIGNEAILSHQARIELGWHNPSGHDHTIKYKIDDKDWDLAAINNAAYNYYNLCVRLYIDYPPLGLRIWRFPNQDNASSTPMMTHGGTRDYAIILFGDFTNLIFKTFAPDITIGTKGYDYYKITQLIFHEMSHASHFSQVGKKYWNRYVEGISLCWAKDKDDTYGTSESTTKYSGYIGVGEMWGYFMETYLYHFHFDNVNDIQYKDYRYTYWFKPAVFGYMVKDGGMKPWQIFKALTDDVHSVDVLQNRLLDLYPKDSLTINYAFANRDTLQYFIRPIASDK